MTREERQWLMVIVSVFAIVAMLALLCAGAYVGVKAIKGGETQTQEGKK